MVDRIRFVFEGKLADQHRMDFYESARFQYAAARLSVKLDQYRRTGRFTSKITYKNNTSIQLRPFEEGSFGIEVLAAMLPLVPGAAFFIEVPLSTLWTYVVERIFKPADEDNVRQALKNNNRMLDVFEAQIEQNGNAFGQVTAMLQDQIERTGDLRENERNLYERLLAEGQRRAYLEGRADQLANISAEDDAKLVTMAAPLLREFSVPLRSSAQSASLSVSAGGDVKTILNVDRQMAEDVELAIVDDEIVPLRIDIIQYNKENGWGKFRSGDFDGVTSFSIPADRKERLQELVLDAMNGTDTFVQAYYVRSMAGVPQRLLLVNIIIDEDFG